MPWCLLPEVQAVVDAPAAVEHRDSNGVLLAAGDTVVLIKDSAGQGWGHSPPSAAQRCVASPWSPITPPISKAALMANAS